jgi:hypothetical protein
VFHPEQLVTKMEDPGNSSSAATTLLYKKLWVQFWTTSESWLTSTLVLKVFSSVIAVGDGTDLGFTSQLVGWLSVD